MQVKTKSINGKEYVEIYLCMKSKKVPGLRIQSRRRFATPITKAEQTRIMERIRQDVTLDLIQAETRGECWFEICELWRKEFLTNRKNEISQETIADNFNALKTWGEEFWKKPATEIKSSDIRAMIKKMMEAGKTNGFIRRVKYAFNSIYSWGMEENLIKGIDRSPSFGITVNRKGSIKRKEVLNRDEVMKLLQAAQNLAHPWYPIWFLALSTGMRNGELHALRFSDLDFSANDGNGNIVVKRSYNTRRKEDKTTKTGDWRNVPMNSSLKEFLLSLKNTSNGREHVLPRFKDWDRGDQSKILRSFCSSIGVTSIHFHALRATFATQMLQNNVAPATVMKIGGWKDIETMGIYLRVSGIEEKGATECLSVLRPVAAMENLYLLDGKRNQSLDALQVKNN